ncbi:unnamed protein product [Cuscuta campestris]|uniref:Uncharacterized protein n=1 Tax=Cuscuta campestris TaxID=132261 RepID=A0A484KUD0_9ASTE|nr:unnamed protein product [Cuscuta campestris]
MGKRFIRFRCVLFHASPTLSSIQFLFEPSTLYYHQPPQRNRIRLAFLLPQFAGQPGHDTWKCLMPFNVEDKQEGLYVPTDGVVAVGGIVALAVSTVGIAVRATVILTVVVLPLTGVVMAEYDIPKSVDKVTDADGKQAHSPILIDTIKLFDLVAVVKTDHLVSLRATTSVKRIVSSFHHFVARAKMVAGSKGGLFLWFSILSPVIKHEWEPPP